METSVPLCEEVLVELVNMEDARGLDELTAAVCTVMLAGDLVYRN